MEHNSQTSLELAHWLISREAAGGKAARAGSGRGLPAVGEMAQVDCVAAVCAKLQITMTVFIGIAGYRSLLMRAIAMAKASEPSLAVLEVTGDGSLSWPHGSNGGTDAKVPSPAGARVLIAQLLDLLVIFVGRPLMLQLVRSGWPDMPDFTVRVQTKDKQ